MVGSRVVISTRSVARELSVFDVGDEHEIRNPVQAARRRHSGTKVRAAPAEAAGLGILRVRLFMPLTISK